MIVLLITNILTWLALVTCLGYIITEKGESK